MQKQHLQLKNRKERKQNVSVEKGNTKMIKEIKYNSHDEWLALRRQYIGGSDAGAVVGLNPYFSAYSLWAEKTGRVPGFEGSIVTRVGSYLEELVAQMVTEETGKRVRRKNRMMVNDRFPFACADIDRTVVGENAIVECKTTNDFGKAKLIASGEYPAQWYCQCVHYMAVGGYDRVYLAVLVGCREFKVFVIERNEEEIVSLMEQERFFWKHVTEDTPPETDGAESTSETVKQLYPVSTERQVDITPLEANLARYVELGKRIKDLQEQQDDAANAVKTFMEDAESGVSDRFKVSFKSSERSTFDSKRFAADHSNMNLEAYYKKSISRVFRVSERG